MSKNRYFSPNSLHICIDSVSEQGIRGSIYSKLQEQPIVFSTVEELLLKADEMFDRVGYPQAFQKKRSFQNKKEIERGYCLQPELYLTDKELSSFRGRFKTVDIVVISRMRTSWQGYVRFENITEEKHFEGELQLLNILENFLKNNSKSIDIFI